MAGVNQQLDGDAADLLHLRRSHQELYRSAIGQLERAKRICLMHGHDTGLGSALLSAGRLHLDSGDVDLSGPRGCRCLCLGDAHEQTPRDAMRAKQHCLEAIEVARQTQNKRLMLSAYIALGETACNEFFNDWSLGKQCADSASELLDAHDADHLVQELHSLKQRLLRRVGIDDVFRAWSEGVVVDKTFKEVTEEFAELITPASGPAKGGRCRASKKLSMSLQRCGAS
jgi:hypothetical protein